MVKLILLVRRAAGLDRDAFRAYYEMKHAPLASAVMSRCVKYVRNFVDEEPAGSMDFDVVTEFWFDVDGPWEQARHHLINPDVSAMLEQDEARFMDRSSMRIFTVREHETDPATLPVHAN